MGDHCYPSRTRTAAWPLASHIVPCSYCSKEETLQAFVDWLPITQQEHKPEPQASLKSYFELCQVLNWGTVLPGL